MGLPGHRRTSSDKRRRSAHFGLKKVALSVCSQCREAVRPHEACRSCGFYRGNSVVDRSRSTKRLLKRVAPAAAKQEAKKKE
ncbi:MAG TPA: 50S ribosomal protein L32 [Patescibacteria group bacterium]|nr:50S ribosomal protein L32 [Patescibacteria group bacterium]